MGSAANEANMNGVKVCWNRSRYSGFFLVSVVKEDFLSNGNARRIMSENSYL